MAKQNARPPWKNRAKFMALPLAGIVIVMVAFGLTYVLRGHAAVQPVGPPGTWNVVFDDEFSETSLDPNYWSNSWFNGGTMNNVKTNAANVSLSGGNLVLTLSSSSVGALVDTDPSQAGSGFQFGTGFYAEARVFFPGSGSTIDNWPAWWTDGQSWPKDGEIDVAEGLGDLTSNYHSPSGANNSGTIPGTWSAGWHTYGVDRKTGRNDIWWDGKLIRSYATNDGGAPEYLIFNVGDGQGPTVTGANGQLKVDYVRVWKYAGAAVRGDLNGDGRVNTLDLSIFLNAWGSASGPADLNGDGTVNILDLSALLGAWTG